MVIRVIRVIRVTSLTRVTSVKSSLARVTSVSYSLLTDITSGASGDAQKKRQCYVTVSSKGRLGWEAEPSIPSWHPTGRAPT